MSNTTFRYTTYIRTTPEKLWQGLTEPALTDRWWGVTFEADWTEDSPVVVWAQGGVKIADPEQVVLAAEPGRRLSYTWHSFTPEWAQAVGIDEELRRTLAAAPRTTVTYEIEPMGEMVKLTLVHDGFEPTGVMYGMCSPTWPLLVASLKSLLETGDPLPDPDRAAREG